MYLLFPYDNHDWQNQVFSGFGYNGKLSKVNTSQIDISNIWMYYCACNTILFKKQNLTRCICC